MKIIYKKLLNWIEKEVYVWSKSDPKDSHDKWYELGYIRALKLIKLKIERGDFD